jgi:hypothetical protein
MALIAPVFTQFMATVSDWRNLYKCIETVLTFPRSVILENWRMIAPVVYSSVAQYPHPLARSARDFCVVVAVALPEEELPDFFQTVFDTFLNNSVRTMRAIYPVIIAELTKIRALIPHMEPAIEGVTRLVEDFDLSVRAAVIRNLHCIRLFYATTENSKREREIIALFMGIARDLDIYVQAIWIGQWRQFSDLRSVSAQLGTEALPLSRSLRCPPNSKRSGRRLSGWRGTLGKAVASTTSHPILAIPQLGKPKAPNLPL